MKRVTVLDVAKVVGCSAATVSLALNGHARISAGTRRRVREAAASLGYQPDPVLSALASHRWRHRSNAQWSTLAAIGDQLEGFPGMQARAVEYGYRLETFDCRDHPDPARLSGTLYHRGIVGVIIGQILTPGYSAGFDWDPFVSVACCEGVERPPVHLVMPNHFRAVQEGWDRAWGSGFRRIGLATFDIPGAMDLREREAAFIERQRVVPVRDRIPILKVRPWGVTSSNGFWDTIPVEEARSRAGDWAGRWRPDAILAFNNAFYWLLSDAGWKSDDPRAFTELWVNDPTPESRGFCLHPDEVGRRAVEWLDTLLRIGDRGLPLHPATMAVNLAWQEGCGGGQRPG